MDEQHVTGWSRNRDDWSATIIVNKCILDCVVFILLANHKWYKQYNSMVVVVRYQLI